MKRTADMLCKIVSALIGAAAAVYLFGCFMLVEVEGSLMLPELEPGQRVLAVRTDGDNLDTGDIVVYNAPFYDIDGQGMYRIRRVLGQKDQWLEVGADVSGVIDHTEIIEKDIVLGKVLKHG